MALDEATSQLLGQMAESGAKPLHEMTPEEARGFGATLQEMYGEGPGMSRVEDLAVPGSGGDIPVRVLVPEGTVRGVIVYYHGGGWVIGALGEFDTLGRTLAEGTSCAVVLVDYRLAPEHRYPAAAEDAWSALTWVEEHRAELAPHGGPMIVMGDSAGGNLAAVVAQRAHSGGPKISLQVLVYPVTDCDLDTPSYLDPANQLMLSRESMVWFWDHYAPDAESRLRPDASPLRAEHLAGLPPAVVLTAEHDPLRDEGERYAERLREAGVPVQSQRFAGQMHGFFTMINVLPGAAASMDYLTDAVTRHLQVSA